MLRWNDVWGLLPVIRLARSMHGVVLEFQTSWRILFSFIGLQHYCILGSILGSPYLGKLPHGPRRPDFSVTEPSLDLIVHVLLHLTHHYLGKIRKL